MRDPIAIFRATEGDAGWIAKLIGTAFQSLAATHWLVPDPTRRAQVLSANFRIPVDHALTHGEVYATADRAAVAIWLSWQDGPPPEPAHYPERLAAACGAHTPRFEVLDGLFAQYHPDKPHHHLAFLATHPDRQRQGLGSALLHFYHQRLDERQQAAYLEASSPENVTLYQRHGYQLTGTPFHLPDGTPFWPMWREPTPDPGGPAGAP